MIRWIAVLKSGEVQRGWVQAGADSGWSLSFPYFDRVDSVDAMAELSSVELLWVDLCGASSDEIERIGLRFHLHPLAIEDCLHADQRPKVEEYAGHTFVVLHSFEVPDQSPGITRSEDAPAILDEAQVRELHCFLLPNAVITVHEGNIKAVEILLNRFAQDRSQLPNGSDLLLHRILDGLVDEQPRYLDELDEAMERLDQEVLGAKHGRKALATVHQFQHRLNFVRRILVPQREVLKKLYEGSIPQLRQSSLPWYRDLLDHVLRVHTQLENTRENLWTIRDAHLAIAAHRTNEAMRRLTVFSVIFLPLTFLTGFFGMNFEAIPYQSRELFFVLLALVVALPIAMVTWVAQKRWW